MGNSILRWGLASLVACIALAGFLILILVVAVALQPPDWLQLIIGVFLALGSAGLAWLIAASLSDREKD